MRLVRGLLSRSMLPALAAAAVVVAGCAPRTDVGRESVSRGAPPEESLWECRPLDPIEAERLDGTPSSWTIDGGSMLSTHRTKSRADGVPGRMSRDEATADALASAAEAALDLLEQRGVTYAAGKRASIISEVVDATARGADVSFPRVQVVARSWDECLAVPDRASAGADTSWRAAVLVEYPIGFLRGDVNNVKWERERAANEAEVLAMSADEHLATGHWHEGLLDATRIARVVAETGVPLLPTGNAPDTADGARSADDRLRESLRWSRTTAESAAPLRARPVGSADVLETGAASGAVVQFRCAYEWNGRAIPAAGVPVAFQMPGASAVLRGEPLTDSSGVATCRILEVHGDPGEYELLVSVDADAVRAATFGAMPHESRLDESGATSSREFSPLAAHTVHLVSGAHAISVCASFGEKSDADAAQVATGFTRRVERDGFKTGECGPNIDVVVTGKFSLAASEEHGSWVASVTLSASVFDQRTASELGSVTVRAAQRAGSESGDAEMREAEVLALKEAGRLLAVYLGPRMLASGR